MQGWRSVYRKELKEFARDKRVMYSAFFGPLFLEMFIIFVFGIVLNSFGDEKKQPIGVIHSEKAAPIMQALTASKLFNITELPSSTNVDELLKRGKVKLVLEFPQDFMQKYSARSSPEVKAIFDKNEETSQVALQKAKAVLNKINEVQRDVRIRELGYDPKSLEAFSLKEESANTGKAFAGTLLVGFLPYLIVIWAFYGGFSIVSDLVAGEKERGSLETLLVSPASRSGIAFGKFLALATVSLTACMSALIGVLLLGILNLPVTKQIFSEGISIKATSVFAIAITLLPLVVFFAAVLLAVSTFSRNQREVQGYLSLASFIVLIPAITSQFVAFADESVTRWLPFIPILNTATVIRQSLLDKVDWTSVAITASISFLLAAFAMWYAIRLFSNEKVLLRV